MMKQKTENRNNVIRKLMVVPLTALLITGLSAREYKTLPAAENGGSFSVQQLTELSGTPSGAILNGRTPDQGSLQSDAFPSGLQGVINGSLSADTVVKATDVTVLTSFPVGNGQEPVIMLNGKETSKKLSDIAPEDIHSVSILKGKEAISKYGKKGEHGVVEIVLKSGIPSGGKSKSSGGTTTPSSPEEGGIITKEQLASTIAASVKYPVRAQEAGMQGEVVLYGFVGNDGKITRVSGTKPDGKVIPIDEIVVVGNGPEDEPDGMNQPGVRNSVFTEESSLRIRNLPNLQIPGYKGQWLKFEFRFLLQ